MAQTRELPPRVSVESIQDWNRIKANVAQAAMSALEASVAGNDPGRATIAAHLQQLLDSSFSMAEKNIRANGHNLEELTAAAENEEAFDEALDEKIWALQAERLAGERDVAVRRRQHPRELQSLVGNFTQLDGEDMEATDDGSASEDGGDTSEELDEHYVASVEMNAKNSSLAEGTRQDIVTQKERIEREQIVERELRARRV